MFQDGESVDAQFEADAAATSVESFHVNGRDIKNNEPAISRTLNYALLYMYIQQNHVMVALAVA